MIDIEGLCRGAVMDGLTRRVWGEGISQRPDHAIARLIKQRNGQCFVQAPDGRRAVLDFRYSSLDETEYDAMVGSGSMAKVVGELRGRVAEMGYRQ